MTMTIRYAFIDHILDAWDGDTPHPYSSEYSRGMYETAIAMLGFNGAVDTEDAILTLWEDVKREATRRTSARHAL
jgi:hypothetical protein